MLTRTTLAAVTVGLCLPVASVTQAAVTLNVSQTIHQQWQGDINIDLTEAGTVDWRDFAWGGNFLTLSDGDRKAGGDRISSLTAVTDPSQPFVQPNAQSDLFQRVTASNVPLAARTTWTDGTVAAVQDTDYFMTRVIQMTGSYNNNNRQMIGTYQEFTVSATPGLNTLTVWGYSSEAHTWFQVILGDETQTITTAQTAWNHRTEIYEIEFASDTPQDLIVRFGYDPAVQQPANAWSVVGVKAVALVPEPASLGLLAAGSLLMLARRRS